jgi:hypothetical protein
MEYKLLLDIYHLVLKCSSRQQSSTRFMLCWVNGEGLIHRVCFTLQGPFGSERVLCRVGKVSNRSGYHLLQEVARAVPLGQNRGSKSVLCRTANSESELPMLPPTSRRATAISLASNNLGIIYPDMSVLMWVQALRQRRVVSVGVQYCNTQGNTPAYESTLSLDDS